MELEAADARERPGGGADLGGVVGEGREVVAVQRDGVGELAAGDLHAVAGIAAEPDDGLLDDFALLRGDASVVAIALRPNLLQKSNYTIRAVRLRMAVATPLGAASRLFIMAVLAAAAQRLRDLGIKTKLLLMMLSLLLLSVSSLFLLHL